jgi:nucleoside-diphosphate-sugar epimerase
MKILVTGAQGFVARYFIAAALQDDPSVEVVGIGRSPRRDDAFTHVVAWGSRTVAAPLPTELRQKTWQARISYRAMDLNDADSLRQLLRDSRPNAIVHLASGLRDDDAAHLVGTNITGSIRLIQAVATADIDLQLLLLGSTGGVYGVPQSLPIAESAPCRPVDLYSATKLGAEHATRVLAETTGVRVIWARLFNLVGPGQDERHVCGRLAAQAAAIARGLGAPVMKVGNLDATRDFIDVRDAVGGLAMLLKSGDAGEVYNVASGQESSIQEVLDLTMRAAGIDGKAEIAAVPGRADDIPRHFADIHKLAALGYRPRRSLRRSITDLVNYYLAEVADTGRSP